MRAQGLPTERKGFPGPCSQDMLQLRAEMCVAKDGLILRNHRIVVPSELQTKVLKIAHDGHQGTTQMKRLLRSKVWFLGMDNRVEDMAKNCESCLLNSTKSEQVPLQMNPLPDGPWKHLSCDFFNLPNGHELCVIIPTSRGFQWYKKSHPQLQSM